MSNLQEKLRNHVIHRGLSRDEDGKVICKNGAWKLMLEAADRLDELEIENKRFKMLQNADREAMALIHEAAALLKEKKIK